jgi:hypothetical protein
MKINKTNFAFTGAAALFVGLAGTAQAIPIPAHTVQSAIDSAGNKKPPGRIALVSFEPASLQRSGNKIRPVVSIPEQGSIPVPSLTMPVVSAPIIPSGLVIKPIVPVAVRATSVPDAGTTAMLLGGSFGGLALLRKKLKA